MRRQQNNLLHDAQLLHVHLGLRRVLTRNLNCIILIWACDVIYCATTKMDSANYFATSQGIHILVNL